MVKTLNLITEITGSREVQITVPDDVPVGLAELFVIIKPQNGFQAKTLGDFLHSRFFGMWQNREDIRDSVSFAQQLRKSAWNRD